MKTIKTLLSIIVLAPVAVLATGLWALFNPKGAKQMWLKAIAEETAKKRR